MNEGDEGGRRERQVDDRRRRLHGGPCPPARWFDACHPGSL